MRCWLAACLAPAGACAAVFSYYVAYGAWIVGVVAWDAVT
jgi:hypothetical protein